jgi:predicted transcriptional regulator
MSTEALSGEPSSNSNSRRTTIDIYADILEVVKHHGGHGRITKISYGVGMPVDRLKRFLAKLEKFGLVHSEMDEDDSIQQQGLAYLVTPRGREFLDTYWRMKAFLDILQEDK